MAVAATTSPPFLPPRPPVTGNPRVTSSSLPSSFPSRERRTNHLRKKILKTLETKPYPDPSSHSQSPLKTLTIPTQQHFEESHHLSQSESTGFVEVVLGMFSNKSYANLWMSLMGVIVFQIIYAFLIHGSKKLDDLDEKDENLISNSSKNDKILLSSGNGSVGELEMYDRIVEIREMARRAREEEKIEAKRKGMVEEESDEVEFDSVDEMVKKKEIDDRLMKLRRSLEGEYQKPGSKVVRKEGDDDLLMFKKKYKYKSPSVDLGDKPKGFGGMKDVRVDNGNAISGVNGDDGTLQTDGQNGGIFKRDEIKEQEPRATTTESVAGTSKEPKYDKQTSKVEKSGISSNLETEKPRGFGKESNDTAKHDDLNKYGSLKGKKSGNKKPTRNLKDINSTQSGFWWTRFPYVMAVAMQSGGDGEESSGLFMIPNSSGSHHTVAFEDPSDATNFSYLLESFFEDLNNFRTSIIPIPTNELEEEVKSQKMNVVVVKKGQLKLYVGQPLEDVESALRILIEQQGG